MYLGQILAVIMYGFCGITAYLGVKALTRYEKGYVSDFMVPIMFFASSIWSAGFSTVHMTTDPMLAYHGRAVGMIGVFTLLIVCQFYLAFVSNLPKIVKIVFCVFTLLGIPIWFLTVDPMVTHFYVDRWGMTYTFKSGFANNVYTLYSVFIGINMMVNTVWMAKKSLTERERSCGRTMVGALIVIIFGMVFDTLFPLFNAPALPGSTITQFLGVMIINRSYEARRKCRLNVENISSYTYFAVSQPVIVFSASGIVKLMNRASEAFFLGLSTGFASKEYRITDMFEVDEDFFEYIGNFRHDNCECIINHKPVYIETSRAKDRFDDTIGYIVTVKDETEAREHMKEMARVAELAESNSRAKSVFLSNMSHEIRTPLNAIVGLSELLLKDENLGRKDEIDEIRNSSNNLLAIINDVLDISKIESGKMELVEKPYNLHEVIKDAYFITATLANKKGLSFDVSVDEEIPVSMYGDPVRIRGVLVNILNNAVKYTRQGGVKLTVILERINFDMAYITFKISDTGIGIKEKDIDDLFTSFSRFDAHKNANIEGTGLGLAIVKGYVDLMKGTINVDSTYGKGTTFAISIPQRIVDGKSAGKFNVEMKHEAAASTIGDVKYKNAKVLAVDDNRVNLKVVSKILNVYKMDVATASDGPSAINLCRENQYDIVLMDQMMPEMDGIEAMTKIRELSSWYAKDGACKIIALTANAVTGVREHLVEKGFDDYISKPINFSAMEGIFTKYLKK